MFWPSPAVLGVDCFSYGADALEKQSPGVGTGHNHGKELKFALEAVDKFALRLESLAEHLETRVKFGSAEEAAAASTELAAVKQDLAATKKFMATVRDRLDDLSKSQGGGKAVE